MPDFVVRGLRAADAEACEAVAATLPTFFGDPDGLRDMSDALRSQRGVVAELRGEIVGFLTIQASSDVTDEITWMAVRADRRRQGIGRRLVEAAAARSHAKALCVLTLGPSVPDAGYEGTRAFYRRMGFLPIKELGLRSWNDSHALVLVRMAD